MRSSIAAVDIANRVRLLRTHHKGAFLIVEGDTDKRFYERYISREHCQIVIAYSKEQAVEALKILEQDHFSGVLAIVDADFDILLQSHPSTPNLLLTDTHDVETMLLKSPALDKVLAEFGSEEKINRHPDILSLLCAAGRPLGYLRLVSLREDLSLRFEELPMNRFLAEPALTVDRARLIRTIKDHSVKPQLRDSDIEAMIGDVETDTHDPWHVCNGHDLVGILSLGLRSSLGTNNPAQVRPEILERSLRLAYEASHFAETNLYTSITQWERANSPYRVLR